MPERPERDADEPFSNPLAPPEIQYEESSRSARLTNADFRKLLMTPRATPHLTSAAGMETPLITDATRIASSSKDTPQETAEERRRKKKLMYAKLKKQEENTLSELAKKYRDRAKERRDGANPDYQQDDPLSSSGGYRAVAPDAKSGLDAAERRKQIIQESKFLGGDMEHTHLVKGLDYALLHKVRSEITTKEKEEEEELEKFIKENNVKPQEEEEEEVVTFKTKMGKNVHRVLFRNRLPERNDAFLPGRMAYVIDPEDDFAESDIPTTLMRSVVDSPTAEPESTLTTNDIVINKLTQILSYLRHGARNKKLKKKGKGKEEEKGKTIDSIYDDVGEYVPSLNKEKERSRPSERKKTTTTYFEKPEPERTKRETKKPEPTVNNWQEPPRKPEGDKKVARAQQLLHKLTSEPEGYAECYPGFDEMNDAIEDSDDEVDYSKMDMGNKKGPIGRWDFDTQEEYSDYMSSKEALPKAAFQYGVKMADGRRTRRIPKGEKNDKQKLDQEWQKIQNIIHKRKSEGDGDRDYKSARH